MNRHHHHNCNEHSIATGQPGFRMAVCDAPVVTESSRVGMQSSLRNLHGNPRWGLGGDCDNCDDHLPLFATGDAGPSGVAGADAVETSLWLYVSPFTCLDLKVCRASL